MGRYAGTGPSRDPGVGGISLPGSPSGEPPPPQSARRTQGSPKLPRSVPSGRHHGPHKGPWCGRYQPTRLPLGGAPAATERAENPGEPKAPPVSPIGAPPRAPQGALVWEVSAYPAPPRGSPRRHRARGEPRGAQAPPVSPIEAPPRAPQGALVWEVSAYPASPRGSLRRHRACGEPRGAQSSSGQSHRGATTGPTRGPGVGGISLPGFPLGGAPAATERAVSPIGAPPRAPQGALVWEVSAYPAPPSGEPPPPQSARRTQGSPKLPRSVPSGRHHGPHKGPWCGRYQPTRLPLGGASAATERTAAPGHRGNGQRLRRTGRAAPPPPGEG